MRSAPMPNSLLKYAASSPTVMPCRAGIGYIPTNDLKPDSISAPSTISPPMGLGRYRAPRTGCRVVPPPASTAPSWRRRSTCGRRPPAGRRRGHRRFSASRASGRDPPPCTAKRRARPIFASPSSATFSPAAAVSTDAVLGGEQGHELQPLVRQSSRCAGLRPVDRAVVGDQPDALARAGLAARPRGTRPGLAARLSSTAARRWCGSASGVVPASRRWAGASRRRRRTRGDRGERGVETIAASRARTIAAIHGR